MAHSTIRIQLTVDSDLRPINGLRRQATLAQARKLSAECASCLITDFLFSKSLAEARYGRPEFSTSSPLEIAFISKRFYKKTVSILRGQRAFSCLRLNFQRPEATKKRAAVEWGTSRKRFFAVSADVNAASWILWYLRPRPAFLELHLDMDQDLDGPIRDRLLAVVAGAKKVDCTTEPGRAHVLQYDIFHMLRPCLRELRGGVDVLVDTPDFSLDSLCLRDKSRIHYGNYIERHAVKRLTLKGAYFLLKGDTQINIDSRFCTTLKELEIFDAGPRHFPALRALAEQGLRLDRWSVHVFGSLVHECLPAELSDAIDVLSRWPDFAQRASLEVELVNHVADKINVRNFCHQRLPRHLGEFLGEPVVFEVVEEASPDRFCAMNRVFLVVFETARVSLHMRINLLTA